MTNPNSFLKWILITFALSVVLTGCNKDLQDDVNDLKDRVTTLEGAVDELEKAIAEGRLITDVKPIEGTPGGWELFFSEKPSIKIYNGEKGDKGDTPYIWINGAGNWATNLGSKPADSDNATYEIKVDGKSVKAYGVSVRVVEKNGYVAFEEYDAITGDVKNTVSTNFPFDGGMIITAILDTPQNVTFTIDGKSYQLAKAAVYPASITVIRDKDYVIKGGTVEFNIAVNPATCATFVKEDFELDFEENYTRAYGVEPDFIKIKSIEPYAPIKGQYTMVLEWENSANGFIKDAAIFVVLNYTDVKGQKTQVISATPVIMNEKYVRIDWKDVSVPANIYLFADEKFTDSVRLLRNYHEGYINTVSFELAGSTEAHAELTKYTPADKFKFSFKLPNSCNHFATTGDRIVKVPYLVKVADKGVPAVPAIPADPTTGTPGTPAIDKLDPITVSNTCNIVTYKVPTYISIWDIADAWIPNDTDAVASMYDMNSDLRDYGYVLNTSATKGWTYELKDFKISYSGGNMASYTDQLYTDTNDQMTLGFDAATRKLSLKRKASIHYGSYNIVATIEAKSPFRHISLPDSVRTIKAQIKFKIKNPVIYIKLADAAIDANVGGTNVYSTYKDADVLMSTLFKPTVFFSSNPSPAYPAYTYATGSDVLGQGIKFEVVSPSTAAEYSELKVLKPAPAAWTTVHMRAYVKLASGREIPVYIEKSENTTKVDANGFFDVKFVKSPLHEVVTPGQKVFETTYDDFINGGGLSIVKQIAGGENAQPGQDTFNYMTKDPAPHHLLEKSCTASVVYSVPSVVAASEGTLPPALKETYIVAVDPKTGKVTAVNTHLVWKGHVQHVIRVTVTDIWGTERQGDVLIKFHRQ